MSDNLIEDAVARANAEYFGDAHGNAMLFSMTRQCFATGHMGQTAPTPAWDADALTVPDFLLRDNLDEPEPSIAMRLIGREICEETRKYDEREIKRAYNHRSEK